MTGRTETGLEIVCPGLFTPVPEAWPPRSGMLGALEKVLSRADCRAERPGGLARNLCRRFGIEIADRHDVPAGALSLLADGMDPGTGYWLRAEPVRLHADRDTLILFGLDTATVSELAASGYIDAFNSHFSPHGWRLVAPEPTRWYLGAPHGLALLTRSLEEVRGRGVEPFLPSGPDAPALRRLVAEAEMLMHGFLTPGGIDTAGDKAANSLWVSGGGVLPRPGPCRLSVVAADDPLVRGLALNAGIEVFPSSATGIHQGGALYVVNAVADALGSGDASDYAAALGQVATQCAGAERQMHRGELPALCLGDGVSRRCCATAMQLRRWWRRRREFRRFLGEGSRRGGRRRGPEQLR